MTELNIAYKDSGTKAKKQASFFEYFFVFVLIIYSGHANKFVAAGSNLGSPIWFLIPVVLAVFLLIKSKVTFNWQFYLLIFCFLIYFFAVTVKYGEIRPKFFLNYALIFFVAYVTIKGLKGDFFNIYEKLIYYSAIIGLVFWGIQFLLGGDSLYNLLGQINSIDEFSNVSEYGVNIIIYSVQPSSSSVRFDFLPPRNCGFAWEPGGFAVYLCLAILVNLFIARKDKHSTLRFLVLLFALMSTQSTTGYLILLVILGYYYTYRRPATVIILLPVIVTALVFIFSLPFMKDKIISLVKESSDINSIVEGSIGRETSINPQRFASFMIAFRDFRDNPVLGLGGQDEESWTYKIGANVSKITGIGYILSQFGIIGFLFFAIISFKTSYDFAKCYKYKGISLLFIVMIFISISYSIIISPLIMGFWMYGLFDGQSHDKANGVLSGTKRLNLLTSKR